MWIKICGNTNLTDAQHAANHGASALGFIFAPSPRRVTVEQMLTISPYLPRNVERYGVFADAGFDEIVATVLEAGLTGVQLHTNDDPELPRKLRDHFSTQDIAIRIGIVAVLPFGEDLDHELATVTSNSAIDGVLIDSRGPMGHGGTGTRYDWQTAQRHFRSAALPRRLIAAGGLNPDNVAEAIQTLMPWGVDVATGVEAAPGRKDPARVVSFIRNARQAFAQLKQAGRQRATSE